MHDDGPTFLTFREWAFCIIAFFAIYVGGSALIAYSIQ